jgi:hypothetical protein
MCVDCVLASPRIAQVDPGDGPPFQGGSVTTEHDIEANPNKILTIAKIGQVRNIKDVQRLMLCLVTLIHFMSRLGEHGLPLYKLLKKSDSFHWMNETRKTLDELKALISKPLILASPEPDETLLLYPWQ